MGKAFIWGVGVLCAVVLFTGCGGEDKQPELPDASIYTDSEICNLITSGRPCWVATYLVDDPIIVTREDPSLRPDRVFCRSSEFDPQLPFGEDFACIEYADGEAFFDGEESLWQVGFFSEQEAEGAPFIITEITNDDGDGLFDYDRFRDGGSSESQEPPESEIPTRPEDLNTPGPGPNFNQEGVMDDEQFTPPDTPVPVGTANCEPGLSKVELDGQEMCISV